VPAFDERIGGSDQRLSRRRGQERCIVTDAEQYVRTLRRARKIAGDDVELTEGHGHSCGCEPCSLAGESR
jgi:hypothetical protein